MGGCLFRGCSRGGGGLHPEAQLQASSGRAGGRAADWSEQDVVLRESLSQPVLPLVGHSDLGLHQCFPWWVTLISGSTSAPLVGHSDLGLHQCFPWWVTVTLGSTSAPPGGSL